MKTSETNYTISSTGSAIEIGSIEICTPSGEFLVFDALFDTASTLNLITEDSLSKKLPGFTEVAAADDVNSLGGIVDLTRCVSVKMKSLKGPLIVVPFYIIAERNRLSNDLSVLIGPPALQDLGYRLVDLHQHSEQEANTAEDTSTLSLCQQFGCKATERLCNYFLWREDLPISTTT